MPRDRRPEYDAQAFRKMWFADVPIIEIADHYGVSAPAIWKAAQRREFMPKRHMRVNKETMP